MNIIEENIETYIVEKKSKFIANIFYVKSIEEAEEKLKLIKKKYYDAKHNCYCYRIIDNNKIIEKTSDDGEPSGTAGMPMLNILKGNNLCNILVVVTRYFGGILLGTGGLVRAYSEATIKAIENSKISKMENGYELEITLDYKNFEILSYYCKKQGIQIINTKFEENVKVILEANEEKKEEICKNSEKMGFSFLKCQIMSKKLIRKIC